MKRKLIASLACRVNSSRLYGKPLQLLDIQRGITVLDYIIDFLKSVQAIDSVVLAVSMDAGNEPFIKAAKKHGVVWIAGEEDDVLGRHIEAARKTGGTDSLIITSESPFVYFDAIEKAWQEHREDDNDVTGADALPDGAGFSITKVDALRLAYRKGSPYHRGDTNSYIREHSDEFQIKKLEIPEELRRSDIRLTIDYPEDLILCRHIYASFHQQAPRVPLIDIISFLDTNPHLKALVSPYVVDPQLWDITTGG